MENELSYILTGTCVVATGLFVYITYKGIKKDNKQKLKDKGELEKMFEEGSSEEREKMIKVGDIAQDNPNVFNSYVKKYRKNSE